MIKKAILLLSLLVGLGAHAQTSVGEWNIFPIFDGNPTTIIDGHEKVYYVSGSRLYSYDKTSDETYYYSTQNKLSDTSISGAFYNPDGKYLLVAYATGNIDVLYDNGKVINLPEIKDASLTSERTINDVAFYKGRIYLATVFGMVVYDEKKMQVVESGIYNKDLQFITVNNDHIVVYPRDSYTIYRSPVGERHNSFDKFTSWFGSYPTALGSAGKNLYLINGNNNTIIVYDVNWDTFTRTGIFREDIVAQYPPENIGDDTFRVITADKIHILDSEGKTVSETALPEGFTGKRIAFEKDLSSVWTVDMDGLGNYDLTFTPPTVLRDKSRPAASTVTQVAFFRLSPDSKRIYFSNIGATQFKSIGNVAYGGHWFAQTTNYIEDGAVHDVSLYNATAYAGHALNDQKLFGNTRLYGGVGRFDIDPSRPERYVIAGNTEGYYVIENGEELAKFSFRNAPMTSETGYTPQYWDVRFDPAGNLWLGTWVRSNTQFSPYVILPKSKLNGDLSTITNSDFIASKHFGLDGDPGTGQKDMGSLFCTRSNMLFTFTGGYQSPLVAYDTKGTYANVSDDVVYPMTNMVDQDGKSFSPVTTVCAVEDNRGRVWVGTSSGIYEITNPSKATDPTMRIRRLKVPRNDGTNYADYLLETDQVNDIAVDSQNRKWIATETSGLYLVSEDGDKILQQFTTDNSILPSNAVQSVMCDPNSNIVYVGHATGLLSYSSSTAPAASDYSEVYAYPNPVRPEYTGVITVTGLMDNSLVKIADSAGNVFAQGRSNGGMFVWDGCDSTGSRVKSGVYYVLSSQNGDGGSSGAVTKILVIN